MSRLFSKFRKPPLERSPDEAFAFCPLFSMRLRGLL
jgi:hypothetical protein